MPKTPPIYGLDFLTQSQDGVIDPKRDKIVAIGLATSAGTELYDGDEAELIDLLDRRLGLLPSGVIATWFGSLIAIPLLEARAEILGVVLQLNLAADRRRPSSGPVLNLGHPKRANWRGHDHFDLSRAYGERSGLRRLSNARQSDEAKIPDASEISNGNPEQNAQLIGRMTERRWPQCRKLVDKLPPSANPIGNQQAKPLRSTSRR